MVSIAQFFVIFFPIPITTTIWISFLSKNKQSQPTDFFSTATQCVFQEKKNRAILILQLFAFLIIFKVKIIVAAPIEYKCQIDYKTTVVGNQDDNFYTISESSVSKKFIDKVATVDSKREDFEFGDTI